MKFLTLTLKDKDAVRAYDFSAGEGELPAEELPQALEHVLFGNDAIFDGEIILTAEYAGQNYTVKRDFAGDVVEVSVEETILPKSKAEDVLFELSALGKKQWKDNLAPIDKDAFLKDCADYVEKRLAAMGFDTEELERRSLSYATERDRALSQVEILDELVVGDAFREELNADILRADKLKEELDNLEKIAQEDADRADAVSRAEKLRQELDEELSKGVDMEKVAEKLQSNATLQSLLPLYKRVLDLYRQVEETDEELRAVTAELESDEQSLNEQKALAEEKKQAYLSYAEKAKELRDEFYNLLSEENAVAVNETILEKMGENGDANAYAAYTEWDNRFHEVAADLKSTRMDYKTRRSVREGVAFETALDDMDMQISTLEEAINARKAIADSLEQDLTHEEEGDFLSLYKSKLLYEVYRSEIAAEENKIRENEAAQKKIDEDIAALEKAKTAVAQYVERANKKNNELSDRLTGVAARKSFCADVTELEYGAVCPVCNNRITDKVDHIHEIEKLDATEKKLNEELDSCRTALSEYSEKSLDINMRLGQLKEKRRLSAVYVDSLNSSVGRKQDAMKEILTNAGVGSYAELDEKCSNSAQSSDAAFLSSLAQKISAIKDETAELENKAADLRATREEMELDYRTEILPELDGNRAYTYLETIVGNEQAEDEKFAELLSADNARNQYVDDLITGADPSKVIRATNEVFRELLEKVRQNDELLQQSLSEYEEITDGVAEKTEIFNGKLVRADELLTRVESDKKRAEELLSYAEAEKIDEETYASLQNDLLSDEQVELYENALNDHRFKIRTLQNEIAALPEKAEEEKPDVREEKRAEYAALNEKIAEEKNRLAASDAAFRLAAKKTEACDRLLHKYEWVKKLADGEISDVILPILNETLEYVGEKATAQHDGLGIKFVKKSGKSEKTLSPDAIDETVLDVALNCAFNYVTGLACGHDTVRFVTADKRGEEIEIAKKYGVIEL